MIYDNNYYLNKRATFRNGLDIRANLKMDAEFLADCYIVNVTFNGFQVLFADNRALFDRVFDNEPTQSTFVVEFEYCSMMFCFNCRMLWKKLIDIYEEDYFVLLGLSIIKESNPDNEAIFELILNELEKKIYIGNSKTGK